MRTRCAAGCTGSTQLAWTGSVTGPAPGASGGSPRRSGRPSSRWPGRCRPGAWPATGPGSCRLSGRMARRSGPWTPSPRWPGTPASRWTEPGPADLAGREGPLAADPQLGHKHRSGVRPKRTRVVELYTAPPPGSTVICADELGPVIPRTFPPAPGCRRWAPDQGAAGVLPRAGEDLGLRRAAGCRRAGGHHVRLVPQSAFYQDFLRLEEATWYLVTNCPAAEARASRAARTRCSPELTNYR